MFSTLLKWLRPKSINRAVIIRQRLAVVYAIVGMNAFIYGLYLCTNHELPFNTEERKNKVINIMISKGKNVEVMHLKGMQLEETSMPKNKYS